MEGIKDWTPTVFGSIVAYILPGALGLISLAFFYPPVEELLLAFGNAQSTIGLSILFLFTSLAIGMQLSALRWVVFEKILLRKVAFASTDFANFKKPDVAASFRVLVDEAYRYHQFFGAQVFVLPVFTYGLGKRIHVCWTGMGGIGLILALVTVEIVTIAAAIAGWSRYVERGKAVLIP
jgi:hypothetical protein